MSNYYNKNKKSYSDVELPTNPNLPSWIITPKEEKPYLNDGEKEHLLDVMN